jgi:hypothetical protein
MALDGFAVTRISACSCVIGQGCDEFRRAGWEVNRVRLCCWCGLD